MKPILSSYFGIPDYYLEDIVTDRKIKICIDPPPSYFDKDIYIDKTDFDIMILIHGCEPPLINDIKNQIFKCQSLFSKIYSFDEDICKLPNSIPFSFGSSWIQTNRDGKTINVKKEYYDFFKERKKNFKLSFIKSSKNQLPGHRLRSEILPILQNKNIETFIPDKYILNKISLFEDSMFHVAIENSQYNNYFTEKVIDCFMSYTIPIYWGCPNIGQYFNKEGMIIFKDKEQLQNIINNLSPDQYISKIDAVKDNYVRSIEYAFFFDRLNKLIKDNI